MPSNQSHDNSGETPTTAMNTVEARTVRIPGSAEHDGQHLITVTLPWLCPRCGGPRGPVRPVISYDGSRRLGCDGWINPCGHIDHYTDVRAEARSSGSLDVEQTR